MKKVILMLCIAFFALNACNKDENETEPEVITIEGTWTASFLSYFRYNQTSMDTVATSEFLISGAFSPVFAFKSDGTFTATEEGENFSGTYVYANNKLTLSADGDVNEYNVQSLTASTLIVYQNQTYSDNGETFYEQNTTTFIK